MRVLLQRVARAEVAFATQRPSRVKDGSSGYLLLVGFTNRREEQVEWMAEKVSDCACSRTPKTR